MSILALDAMGSDRGPEATVAGAAWVSRMREGPHVLLVGEPEELRRLLDRTDHDAAHLSVVAASEVVPMSAKPSEALDELTEASVLVAARLVAAGEADAMVSAGNTGAVTLAAARTFDRLPGVARCALGAVYPTERRRGEKDDPFSLILDAGLTLEVEPADLVNFAIMGAAYSARISKNDHPKVALLSNGAESGKGTPDIVEAHRRLEMLEGLDFIGNVEGMDIPRGTADVVVTGGFTGNIVLKMLEGVAETVMRLGRYAMKKSVRYKAGLALLAPAVRDLRAVTDWEQYGGAPILGFDRLCIKAHGRSSGRAVSNALKVAHKAVGTRLVDAIREGLESGAARPD